MLILTRKKGESIVIDDNIEITIVELSDGRVKLGIDAPKTIEVHRSEVKQSIEEENKKSQSNKNIDFSTLKNLMKDKK